MQYAFKEISNMSKICLCVRVHVLEKVHALDYVCVHMCACVCVHVLMLTHEYQKSISAFFLLHIFSVGRSLTECRMH